jgi:flavin reductase (DIM6/NTAB) family NADH-FMN oxidoreductase RutF
MLSVSLDPPLILISLSARSRTLAAITAQGAFGINVLAAREQQLAERFARSGGDRFAGVRYRFERGVPLLDSAIATAVCRLEQTVAAADHILLLGRPQWCVQDGGPDPLIFLGGAYQTLVPGPASC